MDLFVPKVYQKDIFSINYRNLKKRGIKLLIFDLDNTIAFVDEKEASEKTLAFFKNLTNDFEVMIASNNNNKRVTLFCQKMQCLYLASAFKPFKKALNFVKKKYSYESREIAVIGDQLLTDILFGNRFGMYTILVDPKGDKDLKVTSLNRLIEKRIKKSIKFQKGVYYEKD